MAIDRTAYFIEKATYFARRSNIKNYSTGAVIVDKNGQHVSEGWSHYSQLSLVNFRSIHAELHAILRCGENRLLEDATIYIVNIRNRSKSQSIGLAKPCQYCRAIIYEAGITKVHYTDGNGGILWELYK